MSADTLFLQGLHHLAAFFWGRVFGSYKANHLGGFATMNEERQKCLLLRNFLPCARARVISAIPTAVRSLKGPN